MYSGVCRAVTPSDSKTLQDASTTATDLQTRQLRADTVRHLLPVIHDPVWVELWTASDFSRLSDLMTKCLSLCQVGQSFCLNFSFLCSVFPESPPCFAPWCFFLVFSFSFFGSKKSDQTLV